jgi:hypothetical protein
MARENTAMNSPRHGLPWYTALHAALAIVTQVAPPTAAAQVPPTASEMAAYDGLHRAAHIGDVARIATLASTSPTALQQRDGHGRTPLHVATFARQRGAVAALLDAGADSAALDQDRNDAVTIAAVAYDE